MTTIVLLVAVVAVSSVDCKGGYWEWRPVTSTPTESTSPIVSWRTGQRYFTQDRETKRWLSGEYQPDSRKTEAVWRTQENAVDTPASLRFWEPGCDFPKTPCGIENQESIGAYFESAYTDIGSSYEKVMIVDPLKSASSAARLITPYIKARNREEICLTLQYLIQGEGVESVTVIQQNRLETRPVYSVSGSDKKGMWRLAKMDLVMRDGISRFFLEVRLQSHISGIMMVRELFYEAGKCRRDSASQYRSSRLFRGKWLLSPY